MPPPQKSLMSLDRKHCVITGASRGIGLAIAKLFSVHGARCTLIGRDKHNIAVALGTLKPRGHANHASRTFDVSHHHAWQEFLEDVNAKNDRIDILVNAAGTAQNSLLMKASLEEMNQIIDVNLKGTMFGIQHVIPGMMKKKTGCIINISSLLATHGGVGASAYAASKAGIVGLTRSIAWEVGRSGIRANVILPGYINTNMTKGLDSNGELSGRIPLGRQGLPEEVADAALFLATNTYAHNCVLNIDGGLSAT
ncbi:NAD(P)-binding protein [Astrocystis sublimbata]|nr:NAD(P)-binding protein [Astrocystis sublimbata]